ncbi:MAG: O-methyltransferase [Candidatus Dormibacteria bacterium]
MNDERWDEVDHYTTGLLHAADPVLEAAIKASADLPNISVSAAQAKFLHVLARAIHARRILEVGTLGGYSAIWLGRALPDDGRLITLELNEHHAEVARGNIAMAGLAGKVEVRIGPALDSLAKLKADNTEPFDLTFIDADKRNTPEYFNAAVDLSHVGSLVVVDNVVRQGRLIDAGSDDPDTAGIRRLIEQMGADRRIVPAVIQTVGVKGWDGFALALVVESQRAA